MSTPPGVVHVPRCTLCPVFNAGRCQLARRQVMTDLRKEPPTWCPLREQPVTLQLQPTKS
jgi:hypothetical protein